MSAADDLYRSFVEHDPGAAIAVIDREKDAGASRESLFEDVFVPAMAILGAAWASAEIDEVAFAQASVVAEQLASFVAPQKASVAAQDTVIIGAAPGETHSLARNIVGAALREAGYQVVDLGADVRPADYLERLEETSAPVVIVCAEMMSTARAVERVRDLCVSAGLTETVFFVCGGPFDADARLARDVGANGVVRGAESALRMVARAVAERAGERG